MPGGRPRKYPLDDTPQTSGVTVLDRDTEALLEQRQQESLAASIEKNLNDAHADEAALYGVDRDVWLLLPVEKRRELMARGKRQESTIDREVDDAPSIAVTDNLQARFANLTRGMITRDEKKDWVVVCNPVIRDRRWGLITPGVSRIPRASLAKKTDPEQFNPPFTLQPVAPFPPDPDVLCDMHTADGRACDFATYNEDENGNVSTLLMDHQQLCHPREYRARKDQQEQARFNLQIKEARAAREQNAKLLETIATMQAQLAAQLQRGQN